MALVLKQAFRDLILSDRGLCFCAQRSPASVAGGVGLLGAFASSWVLSGLGVAAVSVHPDTDFVERLVNTEVDGGCASRSAAARPRSVGS